MRVRKRRERSKAQSGRPGRFLIAPSVPRTREKSAPRVSGRQDRKLSLPRLQRLGGKN